MMGYKANQARDQEALRNFKEENPERYREMLDAAVRKLKEDGVDQGRVIETQGYFVACRTWNLVITGEGLRLGSHNDTIWPVYQELEATCSMSIKNHHPISPDYKCQCGIYGMKLGRHPPATGPIAGRLKMWGKYEEAKDGWRTQFAYPEKFESFICCVCNRYFEEWSEAFGFVDYGYFRQVSPHMKLFCYTCHDNRTRSKYTENFFGGLEILEELNETYGLVINPFKSFIEGIEGLGEDNVTDR